MPTEGTGKFSFVDWKTLEDLVVLEEEKENVAEICQRLDFVVLVLGVSISKLKSLKLKTVKKK